MADGIVIKNRFDTVHVHRTDIFYVKSHYRKVFFCTAEGEYWMYRSLDAVMGELDGSFYRAHKSLVINISRAFGIAGDTVFFPNGQKVQLNRDACRKLKRAWFAYHE